MLFWGRGLRSLCLCVQLEEQQAFERSRRFLRQLEISFGDNPSHYQKIIKALQTSPELSPSSIHEVRTDQYHLISDLSLVNR